MKVNHLIVLNAVLCISIAACQDAGTDNNNRTDTTVNNQANKENRALVTNREENFVTNTIEANAEEMAWLRSASNMGTDTELKSQAKQMMNDHEQMDRDMRAYASKKNISLEDVDTTANIRLAEKAGNEWDEEWADEVADMHNRLIRRFERAQNYVQDSELKDIIAKTLPTLRSHRDMAEKLEARLNKSNR